MESYCRNKTKGYIRYSFDFIKSKCQDTSFSRETLQNLKKELERDTVILTANSIVNDIKLRVIEYATIRNALIYSHVIPIDDIDTFHSILMKIKELLIELFPDSNIEYIKRKNDYQVVIKWS